MGRPRKHDKQAFGGTNAYKFFLGAALFLVAVLCLFFAYLGISNLFLLYLLSLNVALFTLCGFDKSIAGSGATRVPEIELLGLALLGGSVGLLCGMKFFRHKIRVARFQFFLLLIIFAQAVAYKYLLKDLVSPIP